MVHINGQQKSWFNTIQLFSFGGCVKEQVYSKKSTTLQKLERGLREVISPIPQEFLGRSIDWFEKNKGDGDGHVEF